MYGVYAAGGFSVGCLTKPQTSYTSLGLSMDDYFDLFLPKPLISSKVVVIATNLENYYG